MNKSYKVPSFNGLKPGSVLSSLIKRRNRSSNTLHEVELRRELRRLGLRFRKNVASLPGRPDIVFPEARVAVFCDGDFWHGRNWNTLKRKLSKGTNSSYWREKIATNIRRDKRNTRHLKESGWHVIRLWETEIRKNPVLIAGELKKMACAWPGWKK